MHRTTRSLAALAAFSATAVLIGGTSVTGAAEPEVPWYQRPFTVGTGFAPLQGAVTGPATVSASGRWVAFTTVDGGHAHAYLRDRWADTTVEIGADVPIGPDVQVTAMSPNGEFLAATGSAGAWIRVRSTGATVVLPAPPRWTSSTVFGINDDGYFLATDAGTPDDRDLGPLVRTARVLPDGTLTPIAPAAKARRHMLTATPSLRYSVHDDGRTDMVTGATLDRPRLDGPNPPVGLQLSTGVLSAGISRDGRYVAYGYALTVIAGAVPTTFHVDVWDTQTGRLTSLYSHPTDRAEVRGVTPDGRVLFVTRPVGTGNQQQLLADPAASGSPPVVVSTAFDGTAVPAIDDTTVRIAPQVAVDIDRVVVCTPDAMSPFDADGEVDCYLRPFPPGPGLGG